MMIVFIIVNRHQFPGAAATATCKVNIQEVPTFIGKLFPTSFVVGTREQTDDLTEMFCGMLQGFYV